MKKRYQTFLAILTSLLGFASHLLPIRSHPNAAQLVRPHTDSYQQLLLMWMASDNDTQMHVLASLCSALKTMANIFGSREPHCILRNRV